MVYAVKNFRHYLLANQFIFFVDQQALLYLVNKPCAIGRIVRWFVILLEFDFTVVVKKGSTHLSVDHLSRITYGEAPTGVDDDIPDATLFQIETAPRWVKHIVSFLSTGYVSDTDSIPRSIILIEDSAPYTLITRRLYRRPDLSEYTMILESVHVSLGGNHYSGSQTVKKSIV